MSGHFRDIVVEHWPAGAPDWVLRLADECDLTSQSRAAKLVGYSSATVSHVFRNTYPGRLDAVEERVRGVLMREVVDCPKLGEIPTHVCADWRAKATNFSSTSRMRVQMHRACRHCPRFQRRSA